MRLYICIFGLIFLTTSCDSDDVSDIINNDIRGTWTIEKIFSNDYWGGSPYWKNSDYIKQVKFADDQKYYVKTVNDFEFIGTYKVLSTTQIEITWDNPNNPQYPTVIKPFEINSDGRLILTTGYTSTVFKEMFKRIN